MSNFRQWSKPKKSSKSKNSSSWSHCFRITTDVPARRAIEDLAVAHKMTIDMTIEKEASSGGRR